MGRSLTAEMHRGDIHHREVHGVESQEVWRSVAAGTRHRKPCCREACSKEALSETPAGSWDVAANVSVQSSGGVSAVPEEEQAKDARMTSLSYGKSGLGHHGPRSDRSRKDGDMV